MPANGETPSFIAVDFLMPYKPTSPPGRRRPVGRTAPRVLPDDWLRRIIDADGWDAARWLGQADRGLWCRLGVGASIGIACSHVSGLFGAAPRPQALMGLVDRGLIKPAGSHCPMTRERLPSIRRLTDDAITQMHPRKPAEPPAP